MFVPIVEIIRLEESIGAGTFGYMRIQKRVFCVTLEPTDEENHPNISSIPAQQYTATRWDSPKYGVTFMVEDVPDRDFILFHGGNIIDHTQGCILLAQHQGKLGAKRAVLNSGNTFKQFMARMDGFDELHLTIHEFY